jgi:hypothetical protein
LFNLNNTAYAYKLISKKTVTEGELIKYTPDVSAIHFWKYGGNSPLLSTKDSLPDTTGKTYVYDGVTGTYKLKAYSRLRNTEIYQLAYDLARFGKGSETDVKQYDYNLNGRTDQEDIEIALSHCMTDPYFILWYLRKEAVFSYFDNVSKLNHTNAVVYCTQNTEPVEFAYNIPTGYLDPNFEGATSKYPVQILPASYYDQVSSKYDLDDFASDEEMSYIVWEPNYKEWAKGSLSNPINWVFRSGLYVYVLDSNGKPILEWIE